MKTKLYKRRRRMLVLLGLGNSKQAVVETLAKEEGCSEAAIYADYERMSTWVHAIEEDENLSSLLRARLEYVNREAVELLQSIKTDSSGIKEKFVKIGALNTVLKVTQEQIKLGQELGLIERKPVEVVTNALGMPWAADPKVMALVTAEHEKQLEQRRLEDERKAAEARSGAENAQGAETKP